MPQSTNSDGDDDQVCKVCPQKALSLGNCDIAKGYYTTYQVVAPPPETTLIFLLPFQTCGGSNGAPVFAGGPKKKKQQLQDNLNFIPNKSIWKSWEPTESSSGRLANKNKIGSLSCEIVLGRKLKR